MKHSFDYFVLRAFRGLLGLGLVFTIFWPAASHAATLSLSPASGSFSPGSFFTVSIMINTSGSAIQGVDVDRLNYNPALLEVYDADASQSGAQITPGNLMPITVMNSVDVSSGKILFSQITVGGATFTGSGVLAKVKFRVKAVGTTNLTFDFSSGSTSDTNISSSGRDVLTSVTNGSYNLTSSGAVTTPEPTPRPSSPATPTKPARPTSPAGSSPSPTVPPQTPEPTPPPRQSFFNKIFADQDPSSMFFVAVMLILAVVVTSVIYNLVSRRTMVGNTTREDRIKQIADFVISSLRNRSTKDEIDRMLATMRFRQDEINEAMQRLKFK